MSLTYKCIICNGRGVLGTGSCPSCICNFDTISIDDLLDKQIHDDDMTEEQMDVWNAYIHLELAKKELKRRVEEFGLAKKKLERNRIYELFHGD